jgi:hypothetical protein
VNAALREADGLAKRLWHDELVRTPETHAWVLDLYRAGERHPETVDDYFPWRAAVDPWPQLASELKRHAAEERGHAHLYARAIRSLGKEPEDLGGLDVFNHAIRAETAIAWQLGPGDPVPMRRLALAHFLAHAHCLERRVARSLEHHHRACRRAGKAAIAELVERVLRDEERHVASTLRGLSELTSTAERERILAFHAEAEARADRAFSARQVRSFLRRFPERGGRSLRLGFRLGACVLEARRG